VESIPLSGKGIRDTDLSSLPMRIGRDRMYVIYVFLAKIRMTQRSTPINASRGRSLCATGKLRDLAVAVGDF
jgi:hypothetical protein